MLQIKILVFFIGFSCIGFAQNANNAVNSWSKDALLQHVKTLSSDIFEGRRTGTKGAVKAKKYIINQFYSSGLKPFKKSFEQPFTFVKGNKTYNASNVLGVVKGTEHANKYIVISAHYDHEGKKGGQIFNGADDNASGVSALFAFAEYFKTHPPKHSVILAAFDAEELGLRGSKYFVSTSAISLKNIKLNINLDMISRSVKNELFVVGTAFNKTLKQLILGVNTVDDLELKLGHDGEDGLENWTYASDHANFYKNNIPFLYFGVEDHKDYHEPTDDYENIHPEFYKKAVETIMSVFEKTDKSL
ncbi:M20/M25/M40 family metallo-hydrolase [Postechiella marina]|uniref:M20/M25/M40 family metallo-hydrolase n=1 Tax=Postechiella marina TaxID=943941 RepID=A0ABP8C4C7_9FLAO